jgi:hypothetical protein
VRSWGLTRNRDLTGKSRWTGRGKKGEDHASWQTSPMRRRQSQGASQGTCRLPQPRLLGRFIDAIRMAPCGHRACSVTFPRYRCKPFVLPVLFWERVRSLPLLLPKATKKAQSHHTLVTMGNGRLRLRRQKYQRRSVVNILLRTESDI